MKIARIIVEGEDGQQVVFDQAPFYLDCTVGRCEMHGGDDIYAICPHCRKAVCSGHWNEEQGLCQRCTPVSEKSSLM
jgi:hypothetical protein